jgi:hypothetical protein
MFCHPVRPHPHSDLLHHNRGGHGQSSLIKANQRKKVIQHDPTLPQLGEIITAFFTKMASP